MQANLGEPYYIVLYNLSQPHVPFNNKLRDGTFEFAKYVAVLPLLRWIIHSFQNNQSMDLCDETNLFQIKHTSTQTFTKKIVFVNFTGSSVKWNLHQRRRIENPVNTEDETFRENSYQVSAENYFLKQAPS